MGVGSALGRGSPLTAHCSRPCLSDPICRTMLCDTGFPVFHSATKTILHYTDACKKLVCRVNRLGSVAPAKALSTRQDSRHHGDHRSYASCSSNPEGPERYNTWKLYRADFLYCGNSMPRFEMLRWLVGCVQGYRSEISENFWDDWKAYYRRKMRENMNLCFTQDLVNYIKGQ